MAQKLEPEHPLQGMRILVVDDEILIALNLEETFREAGAEIVSASTIAAALQGAKDESLSAAVLDIRLGRQTTEPVADILAGRGIPFLFYSGQALPDRMRDKYPTVRVLVKPVKHSAFVTALLEAMERPG